MERWICIFQLSYSLEEPVALVTVPFVIFFGQGLSKFDTTTLPPIEVYHGEHVQDPSIWVCIVVLEVVLSSLQIEFRDFIDIRDACIFDRPHDIFQVSRLMDHIH